jgi:hypothetical protein
MQLSFLKKAFIPWRHKVETTFYTVLKAAFEVGQTALGYKLKRHEFNKEKNFGIVINPVKNELVTFDDDDLIIVFAEN